MRQYLAYGYVWNGATGKGKSNGNGWNGVSDNQHAVLCDLRVGDALHAAQYGVRCYDGHTDDYANGNDFHPDAGGQGLNEFAEEAAKHHANTAHLASHVGERDKDGGNSSNDTGVV